MSAVFVALVAAFLAAAAPADAIRCKGFFSWREGGNSGEEEYRRPGPGGATPSHACAASEMGDCSLEGLAANRCVPYQARRTGTAVACYEVQECAQHCFTARRARDLRVYAGCETHWDSAPLWGHGAALPGAYGHRPVGDSSWGGTAIEDGVLKCGTDLCNDGGARRAPGAAALALVGALGAWAALGGRG